MPSVDLSLPQSRSVNCEPGCRLAMFWISIYRKTLYSANGTRLSHNLTYRFASLNFLMIRGIDKQRQNALLFQILHPMHQQ